LEGRRGCHECRPETVSDAELIAELNYDEVIEMAYYGAQVIHPRPLNHYRIREFHYVKCFWILLRAPSSTTRAEKPAAHYCLKQNQVLMHLHSVIFHLLAKPVASLYHYSRNPNTAKSYTQSGAVSLQGMLRDKTEKLEKLTIS
jgi:aspartate kinase